MSSAYAVNGTRVEELTFEALAKAPEAAKKDRELQAYFLGLGTAIRFVYECPFVDDQTLRDPSAMIDALVEFAGTPWGKVYLSLNSGIGGLPDKMGAGTALFQLFTEHQHCLPYKSPREQR